MLEPRTQGQAIALVDRAVRSLLRGYDLEMPYSLAVALQQLEAGSHHVGPILMEDGGVKLVGFDSSDNLVKGLRDGHIDALVMQDPVNMGYLSVKTLVRHLKGETVEKRIDTGARVVAREQMDQPEMKELLSPDLSKWLKK